MVAMEVAMNSVDWLILGEAKLVWWIVPLMLLAGFLTPWPYNYYRLKKYKYITFINYDLYDLGFIYLLMRVVLFVHSSITKNSN